MQREWLEAQLEAGKSLERIGREVGKDRSTIGYWVRKHGLVANGQAKYAPRDGVSQEELAEAVGSGLTLEQLARRFHCSTSTVCYWLGKHELSTIRARQPLVRSGDETGEAFRVCRTHGLTAFVLEGRGYYRCKECRKHRVMEWRRRAKLRLIAEAGGACRICGYHRHPGALHFHHLDPGQKEFALGGRGLTRGIGRLRVEAAKCVLLCSNCHAEVEAGVTDLPPAPRQTSNTPNR